MCAGPIFDVFTDIFGGGKKEPTFEIPPPTPIPAPIDTSKENEAALARRAEEERRAKNRKGAASTIVTNPLGITTPATVSKSMALGIAK